MSIIKKTEKKARVKNLGARDTRRIASVDVTLSSWNDTLPGLVARMDAEKARTIESQVAHKGDRFLEMSQRVRARVASYEATPDSMRVCSAGDFHLVARHYALQAPNDRAAQLMRQSAEGRFKKAAAHSKLVDSTLTMGEIRQWEKAASMGSATRSPVVLAMLTEGLAQVATLPDQHNFLNRRARRIASQADFDQQVAELGIMSGSVEHRFARAYLARQAEACIANKVGPNKSKTAKRRRVKAQQEFVDSLPPEQKAIADEVLDLCKEHQDWSLTDAISFLMNRSERGDRYNFLESWATRVRLEGSKQAQGGFTAHDWMEIGETEGAYEKETEDGWKFSVEHHLHKAGLWYWAAWSPNNQTDMPDHDGNAESVEEAKTKAEQSAGSDHQAQADTGWGWSVDKYDEEAGEDTEFSGIAPTLEAALAALSEAVGITVYESMFHNKEPGMWHGDCDGFQLTIEPPTEDGGRQAQSDLDPLLAAIHDEFPGFVTDEDVNGGDLVDFINGVLQEPWADTQLLKALKEHFPGFVDGEQDVNGGDLVDFLNRYNTRQAKTAYGDREWESLTQRLQGLPEATLRAWATETLEGGESMPLETLVQAFSEHEGEHALEFMQEGGKLEEYFTRQARIAKLAQTNPEFEVEFEISDEVRNNEVASEAKQVIEDAASGLGLSSIKFLSSTDVDGEEGTDENGAYESYYRNVKVSGKYSDLVALIEELGYGTTDAEKIVQEQAPEGVGMDPTNHDWIDGDRVYPNGFTGTAGHNNWVLYDEAHRQVQAGSAEGIEDAKEACDVAYEEETGSTAHQAQQELSEEELRAWAVETFGPGAVSYTLEEIKEEFASRQAMTTEGRLAKFARVAGLYWVAETKVGRAVIERSASSFKVSVYEPGSTMAVKAEDEAPTLAAAMVSASSFLSDTTAQSEEGEVEASFKQALAGDHRASPFQLAAKAGWDWEQDKTFIAFCRKASSREATEEGFRRFKAHKVARSYGDVEGIEPAEKDIARMESMKAKAGDDAEKVRQLAANMAQAITDSDKALRRAKAAELVFDGALGDAVSKIFEARAKELD